MQTDTPDERKLVSVLFCDIAGSYTYLYDSDPEQGKLIIDLAVAEMTAAIERFGGVINQVQGDGVMSLFGAPKAVEDHAYRACQAAVELIDVFEKKNAQGGWPNTSSVEIRIGISTGEAVVGIQPVKLPIGGERYEYFATGAVSHLAGRLQKLASAFEIVISENTAAAVGSMASTSSVPDRSVHELIKGHAKPLLLMSLNRQDVSGSVNTNFVGRSAELQELSHLFEQVADTRKSGAALLCGEPGIGKTRLLNEFLNDDQCLDWRIYTAHANSLETNFPFAVLRRILQSWLGVSDDTPVADIRSKLADACFEIEVESWRLPESLAEVLGLPVEDERWSKFEADIKRNEIYRSLLLLLMHWSVEKTICVVEDLHWADNVSLQLLESAAREVIDGRLVFVMTSREKTSFQNVGSLRFISLDSLEPAESRLLFDSLAKQIQLEEHVISNMIGRSGGVPLFIEQIAYSADHELETPTGIVSHSDLSVSHVIRSLISSRIDRLPALAKHTLGITSIAGPHFGFSAIHAVMGMNEGDLQSSLAILVEEGLITPVGGYMEYRFVHALYQEVAYLGLLKSQLQIQHRAFLDYFKRLEKSRTDPSLSEQIHHHAFRGQVWTDVVNYSSTAARTAMDKGAYREAIYFLEQGLQAHENLSVGQSVEEAGEHEQDQTLKAVALLELSRAGIPCGEFARSYQALDDCQTISSRLQNEHIYCESFAYRTALFAVQKDSMAAVACGERAVAAAENAASDRLVFGCTVYLAEAVFFNGNFPRVIDLLQPMIDTAVVERYPFDRIGNMAPASIDCYGILGMAYAQLGQFEKAENYGELACEIADRSGKSFDRGLAYFYSAFILVHRCKMSEAQAHLNKVMEVVDAGGVRFLSPWFQGLMGFICARQGQLEVARQMIEHSIADAKSMSLTIFELYGQVSLAFVQVQAGEYSKAEDTLSYAENMADRDGFNSVQMWILRSKGVLARASGQTGEAVEYFLAAIERAEELGMWPDVAHCHAMIAEAIADGGVEHGQYKSQSPKVKSSDAHQAIAQQLYSKMGMEV